jgi:hypothetical protein
MTVVALTTIQPRPGVQWDDVQKHSWPGKMP